jgi:4'-phosphopantetheinyl transferase
MVYVFTAGSTAYSLSEIIRDYKAYLPVWCIEKAGRYAFEKDACHFLLGKLLFLKGLRKLGYCNVGLDDIRFTTFRKPYLNNGLSFNISHSGKFVVCALSKTCKVGIDLEEVKFIEINSFSSCFSAGEWSYLTNSADPLSAFYKLWTKKEAVIKADGRGLHIPLSCFEVINSNVSINSCNWFIKELSIAKGYIAHIATDRDVCDNYFIEPLI